MVETGANPSGMVALKELKKASGNAVKYGLLTQAYLSNPVLTHYAVAGKEVLGELMGSAENTNFSNLSSAMQAKRSLLQMLDKGSGNE